MSRPRVFRFRFDPRFRLPLAALGILPGTASVVVADGELTVRFGPWRLDVALDNVVGAEVTGPYKPYRAIGVRLSGSDLGLTFGSTAAGGVCITFAEPVPGFDPLGALRHPGLTVTVEDPEGLVEALGKG